MVADCSVQSFQFILALHDYFHYVTFLGYPHDEAVLGGGQYFSLDELDNEWFVVGADRA